MALHELRLAKVGGVGEAKRSAAVVGDGHLEGQRLSHAHLGRVEAGLDDGGVRVDDGIGAGVVVGGRRAEGVGPRVGGDQRQEQEGAAHPRSLRARLRSSIPMAAA